MNCIEKGVIVRVIGIDVGVRHLVGLIGEVVGITSNGVYLVRFSDDFYAFLRKSDIIGYRQYLKDEFKFRVKILGIILILMLTIRIIKG